MNSLAAHQSDACKAFAWISNAWISKFVTLSGERLYKQSLLRGKTYIYLCISIAIELGSIT